MSEIVEHSKKYKTVQSRVLELLEILDYTKSALARKMGISPVMFGKMLNGERSISLEHLFKISDALEVPLSILLDSMQPELEDRSFNLYEEFASQFRKKDPRKALERMTRHK